MEKYKVGQVLFLIGEKTTKVIPIQIIEEVIRTTLDGKIKTYTVQLPDQSKTQVDISEVKGRIFNSHKTVREFMIKNASAAIDKMISNARKISTVAFHVEEVQEEKEEKKEKKEEVNNSNIIEDVQKEEEQNILKIDLGGGQMANVSTNDLSKLSSVRAKWKYCF